MCSRVEADDSEASPKLSGGAGGAKRDGYDRDDIRVREGGIQKDSSHGDIYVYVDIYIYIYMNRCGDTVFVRWLSKGDARRRTQHATFQSETSQACGGATFNRSAKRNQN